MHGSNAYIALVGMSEGKTLMGRPDYGWEDAVKVDLKEVGWKCVDWIPLAGNGDQ
jgi:hypothetical protein